MGPSIEEGYTEDGTADGATDGAADGTKVGTEEGITFDTGDETEEETMPTETDGKQMRRGRTTRSRQSTYRPARLTDEMNCAELTFAEKTTIQSWRMKKLLVLDLELEVGSQISQN